MKLFLHTNTRIRIIHGDLEWSGTPAQFMALEPAYPGLPSGYATRYQTPDMQYLADPNGEHSPDTFDALPYCDNISNYLSDGNYIYAHVTLSQAALNVSDPEQSLAFEAALKATSNPADSNLPITATWVIKLRHEGGEAFDSFLAEFVNGACAYTYTYKPELPLGDWYVNESDFGVVQVGEMTYYVRLVNPVYFVLYRQFGND